MISFLSLKSLLNRKFTTILCIVSIALSVTLFLSIEKIRKSAEDGFTNTISQTDLIVGAKGGALELLLYSVFHMGNPINNIRYSSFQELSQNPQVAWTIPLSMGDAYRGHRVIGTNENFYKHYRYHGDQEIQFQKGEIPNDTFDVTIGAEVAKKFNLKINDPIILSHGIAESSLLHHQNTPFKVTGILKPTFTPIDQALYIDLAGMEALHFGWETGVPSGEIIAAERFKKENIEIHQITSVLIKLKSRIAVLKMRRNIDQFESEPLMAIIPAFELQNMWKTLGKVEDILKLVSLCVLVVGVLGILICLYTTINERRREMSILRSLGASASHIFSLLMLESTIIVFLGCALGVGLLYLGLYFLAPVLQNQYSVFLKIDPLSMREWIYLLIIFVIGSLAGLIPAIKAYYLSLHDGMTIKL